MVQDEHPTADQEQGKGRAGDESSVQSSKESSFSLLSLFFAPLDINLALSLVQKKAYMIIDDKTLFSPSPPPPTATDA